MNEIKTRVRSILVNDTTLRSLLSKAVSPFGIYFARPPEKPVFPLVTFSVVGGSLSGGKDDGQVKNILLQIVGYSGTNYDAIMERVEKLFNQTQSFTNMNTCRVWSCQLDYIMEEEFDPEFGVYASAHRYRIFYSNASGFYATPPYLEDEAGGKILLEDGGKLILE